VNRFIPTLDPVVWMWAGSKPKMEEAMMNAFVRLTRSTAAMALVLVAVSGVSCSDSTGTGTVRLTVVLTDDPADYFDMASVTIGEVWIVPVDGDPILLAELPEPDNDFNLLDFQNGATATLASVSIDPGTYAQLRLVIDGASVTLKGDFTFSDDTQSRDLRVPSGAQSGLKLNLRTGPEDEGDGSEGITITDGETIVVVEIDVSKNFVIQGNPDSPAGIHDVLFTPLAHVTVEAGTP
jgi:hypothetical protein